MSPTSQRQYLMQIEELRAQFAALQTKYDELVKRIENAEPIAWVERIGSFEPIMTAPDIACVANPIPLYEKMKIE